MMKRVILFILLSVFLAGCGVEFGQNYNHLQNQDPTKFHEVDIAGDTNRNVGNDPAAVEPTSRGLYEELNNNLCDLQPECCGQYTKEQKDYRDFEKRAVVEQNVDLCMQLPAQPFIISCGNDFEEDTILYSRQRCLDNFS